jgi:hypothetical protein
MHHGLVDMLVLMLLSFLVNGEREVKEKMGAVMDAVTNVTWDFISHDRMGFSFPGVEPVHAPKIQQLFADKVTFFLGNSNLRRLFIHTVKSSFEFYPETSRHESFTLNDDTRGEDPSSPMVIFRDNHGGKWLDVNYVNGVYHGGNSACAMKDRKKKEEYEEGENAFKKILDLEKIIGCDLMPIPEKKLMEKHARLQFQFTADYEMEWTLSFYMNYLRRTRFWKADFIIIQLNGRLKEVSEIEKFVDHLQSLHSTQDRLNHRRASVFLIDDYSTTVGEHEKTDPVMEEAKSIYLNLRRYLETIPNVYLVPVAIGELRGHLKGLKHTKDSFWHSTYSGIHFQAQALLVIIQCLEEDR